MFVIDVLFARRCSVFDLHWCTKSCIDFIVLFFIHKHKKSRLYQLVFCSSNSLSLVSLSLNDSDTHYRDCVLYNYPCSGRSAAAVMVVLR